MATQFEVKRRQRFIQQQTFGLGANARASATRCCCPPICDGRRSANASFGSGQPLATLINLGLTLFQAAQTERNIFIDAEMRKQGVC